MCTSDMAEVLEEQQMRRALNQIRELNTELSMHEDAQVQVGALRKKIASTKERARGLVNMIDKRIAYLSDAWKQHMAIKDDYENLEIARGAVSDPVRIGLNKDGDESFFARVNVLKEKVAELMLLDEQAAEAHKKAAADNKTLNMAADMLKEVEDRQRVILANNDNCFSEETHPVLSLRRAIAAIDARLNAQNITNEGKSDLEKLARDLRLFLTGLPDHASRTTCHDSPTGSPTELRVNFTNNSTGESSSGISGTTVPTNETSSGFSTSTGASVSSSAPTDNNLQVKLTTIIMYQ
ncbi:hypothetical protein GCK32_007229 [Trichostrongylus colubriformis]|uniref:Uncharacterized protein n=1 Tax=Trichostrongylus colubriformis TaxID=6319 RepID=A0AAN8F040_TRICO